ncbi:MAG: flippase activity-associated protein Agl23 [Dehalococcoidia bacterium]|jgi:uncharacterized protein (TIGR03663 family)
MAGITRSARIQGRASGRVDKPPLGRRFPVARWELVVLLAILAVAALLRFWDLGARTFHGDEAITAGFSWQLADGRGYIHNPLTHGPFQFLGTALVFVLFGDSDYTARVLPALFGTALVGLPFFLRGHLGRTGAIVSALLLAVSPTLLYFSRFAREDIYIAFFTLAMFICIWRYLQQPRRLYLYMIAALLALTFATKEVAYIIVALLMVYLDLLAARELAKQTFGEATPDAITDSGSESSQPSHYELLGLADDASVKDIRRAYRRLAKGQRGDGARGIEQAFTVLSDAGKRQSYNRRLAKMRAAVGRPDASAPTGVVPQLRRAAVHAAFLPATPVLLAFWPLLRPLRRRLRLDVFPRAGHLIMLVGCLTLPLFAAAVEKLPFVGDRGAANPAAEVPVMHATVLTLLAVAFLFGFLWRRQVWLASAAIFWAIFIFFFTSFFTNANGFWSGTWGSLDYWLGQQGVGLGSEPGYYYFMLLPVYEFLPLVFALGTVIFCFLRGKRSQRLIALAALGVVIALAMVGAQMPLIGPYRAEAGFVTIIAAMLVLPMDPLTRFLLYWTLSALFAFTVAGEKMPWLNVHIALPLALLAGRSIGRLISGLELRVALPPLRRWAPLAFASLSTALAAGLFVLAGAERGPAIAGWLLVAAALLTVLWSGRSLSLQAGLRIAATALGAALLVFTVRASVLSSWGHPNLLKNANTLASRDRGDTPIELLDFVQTSPDVPVVRDAIDAVAAASGEGDHLPIVIDATDDFSWPWAWYLRKYDNLTIQNIDKDYTPPPGSVVLAKWQDNSYLKIDPTLFTEGTRYHHRWWFPTDYRGLSSSQVVRELFDASAWETWGRYLADRSLPQGLPALDAVVYFPRDVRYSEVLSSTLHKKSP